MPEPEATTPSDRRYDALQAFAARVRNTQADTSELDQVAAEAIIALEGAGIQTVLLKGSGLGALLYGRGGRGYSDVDLLVAPGDLDGAERTLTGLGYRNVDAVQGVDDRIGAVQAHTWVRDGGGSLEHQMVDLHWALPGAGAPPSTQWQALAARTTTVAVGGHGATTLDRDGQALHLAMHAAQHGASFDKQVRELALAISRWPLDVWQSAAVLAKEIDAAHPFAAGLRLVPEGAQLAARLDLPATPELDWALRHRGSEPRGTLYLRALAESGTPRERLRALRLSVFPSPTWVAYQYPWARDSRLRISAAYGLHLLRLPVWGARAWLFLRRTRHQARSPAD